MGSRLKHTFLRPIPHLFSDWIGLLIARIWSGKLRKELTVKVTDAFLTILLNGMDLAFCLIKDYRKNIKDFEGRYLFRTAGNRVAAAATFKDGAMTTHDDAIADWDVRGNLRECRRAECLYILRGS